MYILTHTSKTLEKYGIPFKYLWKIVVAAKRMADRFRRVLKVAVEMLENECFSNLRSAHRT